LLENKFPYDSGTFANAAKNGTADNIKWLSENKFPFDSYTFIFAAENEIVDNMKLITSGAR
jgi:hypothetical protein